MAFTISWTTMRAGTSLKSLAASSAFFPSVLPYREFEYWGWGTFAISASHNWLTERCS